jgi:hypothetical protein
MSITKVLAVFCLFTCDLQLILTAGKKLFKCFVLLYPLIKYLPYNLNVL